ncbi:cytochrome P450 [Trichoderma barbatum]
MKDIYHVLLAPSYVFGAAAVVGLLYLLCYYIRDPLLQVPGPWYAKWTSLVIKYHWMKGNRARYQHELHLKYGPLVRLTPNEVSVTNIEAVKKIYNARETYRKTAWYADLSVTTENLFNTTRVDVHRRLRRLLSGSMSETSLHIAVPQIQSKIDLAIQRMGEEMENRGAADIIKWFLFMATDVIGELSFGDSFRTLEIGEKSGYTKDLENLGYLGAVRSAFPTFIALAKYLPIPFFTRPLQATKNMIRYSEESIARYRNLLDSDPTSVKWTLFTKVFKDTDKDALTPLELRANASGYIVAGSDSTAVTLTYLVWSVCRNPIVKATLLEELQTLPADFTASHLRDLSYLNHVIDETLRLYAGIQSSLPRYVPQGGDDIAGYWLPGGTSICTQAYSMHRIASVFPDPDVFNPSRWESPTKEMKDSFMPFGGGSRICIGLHLARIELRYATARFFLTYPEAKVSTLEGFSDEDMVQRLFFFEEPTGKRCLIQRY